MSLSIQDAKGLIAEVKEREIALGCCLGIKVCCHHGGLGGGILKVNRAECTVVVGSAFIVFLFLSLI